MENFFAAALNHFSFTELVCFFLLWRVENKLAAATDAIHSLINKFEGGHSNVGQH